jgi:hypothetical protein
MKRSVITVLGLLFCAAILLGQWGRRGRGRGYSGEIPKTAREFRRGDTELPTWTNPPAHAKDVFTFVRIIYDSGYGGWGRRGGGWATDLVEGRGYDSGAGGCSDINLSWRLQQLTSMRTDPDGRLLRLTDPELADFPFIYMVEPGALDLSDEEADALRKYLLNGGFLMMDDFWGDSALEKVVEQMRKVFPSRPFFELPLNDPNQEDHPIYHCVFEIKAKGQVPNMHVGDDSQIDGVTWEDHDGDTQTVRHMGINDDQQRLMVIACHNTDNGDGWEREGWSDYYFHNFSEKVAYPLGINIIFYAMTH